MAQRRAVGASVVVGDPPEADSRKREQPQRQADEGQEVDVAGPELDHEASCRGEEEPPRHEHVHGDSEAVQSHAPKVANYFGDRQDSQVPLKQP